MEICCVEDCGPYTVRPVLAPARCADAPVECFPCLPHCTKAVYCFEKSKPHACSYRERRPHKCCEDGCHSHTTSQCVPCEPPNNHQDCCYVRSDPPRQSCSIQDCKPIKTKYIMPCYRYEDGRIVRRLPVTAFKRNGIQDQEHGKVQGATNFLQRYPRDVEVECDVCTKPVKVCDPAMVPLCDGKTTLGCQFMRKKPVKANQPTVLTRRACEVAVGKRPRKKPYVETSFVQEGDQQESRYIREDDEGNLCYHFEKLRTSSGANIKARGSSSCPQYQYCMENPPCMTGRREPSPPPAQTCYYSYTPCYPC